MYNYKQAIKNDILDYLACNGGLSLEEYNGCRILNYCPTSSNIEVNYDLLEEALEKDLNVRDAATGMQNGAYKLHPDQAECGRRLMDAMDFEGRNLLTEMLETFEVLESPSAGELDTMLREYLFHEAVSELVKEIEKEYDGKVDPEEGLDEDDLDMLYKPTGKPELAGIKPVSQEEIVDRLEEDVIICVNNTCELFDGFGQAEAFKGCEQTIDYELVIGNLVGSYDPLTYTTPNDYCKEDIFANLDLVFEEAVEWGYSVRQALESATAATMLLYSALFGKAIAQAAEAVREQTEEAREEALEAEELDKEKTGGGLEDRIATAQHACEQSESREANTQEKATER